MEDFWEKLKKIFNEVSSLSGNAFVPYSSLGVVNRALKASGIAYKKSDGTYKTPSKGELKKAQKDLNAGAAASIVVPAAVFTIPYWMPYLSAAKTLGTVGHAIGGTTGGVIGTTTGALTDAGLAGYNIYDGSKEAYRGIKNKDALQTSTGVATAALNALPFRLFTKGIRLAGRAAAADNFLPLGYTETRFAPSYSQKLQLKRTVNLTFNRFTTNRMQLKADETPYWRTQVKSSNEPFLVDNISHNDMFKYREDAWRLAMRLPQSHGTYISNSDGTYRYNPSIIEPTKTKKLLPTNSGEKPNMEWIDKELLFQMPENSSTTVYDAVTTNGGWGTITRKGNTLEFIDTWDLQPFKDEFRLGFGKFGKFMHKYFPNFEAVSAVGGDTFKVKTPFMTK